MTYQGRYAGGDEAALNARIIESADDIFQVVGVKGHILATTSRGAKMMLADRTDASAGKPWLDLWLGGERIAAERAFNEALAGRRGFFTAQSQFDSGSVWLDIVLTPMRAAAGGISEVLVVSRDISIRHAAQEQLRQSEEQYRQVAVALQTASLPRVLPRIGNLEIDAYYCPSSASATICGDWYDAAPLGDKKVLFTIGDVAGHGLNAAVTMTRIKQAMEAVGLLTRDPAVMLKVANEIMRRTEPDLFATALVGVFDGDHRTLTMATAGHPPPIVREGNGVPRECDLTPGLPLGVMTTLNAEPRTIQISSGSAIVMFTDGLVESDRNIISGYRRLIDALLREDIIWSSRPAAKIVETALNKSPALDDIAVLVLREHQNT